MGLLEYNPLDLPASLADQHFEEEESESDIEDDEAKQPDAANGGQQVLAKDGKNGPSAQLKPSQAKSPEALAAELGIPVSKSQRARKSRVSADA
ncbi:hypothetical protein DUNSADRAFT_14350 [Dunaliella salina]|uniref:Uncharacterized protein n=1 Tax=Dunaliella salina TaxID=3046 RepID=A0ABQ7G7H7_DUNSA|nr:hypothetical protein DUNSADRAFT_14350 [Dunaliella salina]|eukprot:KAF5830565.1 hypothetical protein DUNSADRAFT_14350 [Dunaliella salina]